MNYLKKILVLILASVTGFAQSATDIRSYPMSTTSGQVVYSNTFDSPQELPPHLRPDYQVLPGAGRNGTKGLCYVRTNPKIYVQQHIALPQLSPAQTYELEVYVRGENIVNHGEDKNIGGICIENFKNGKWHSGTYFMLKQLGTDWKKLQLPFIPVPGTETVLNLYLRKGYTGKICFDDLIFRTAGAASAIILNEPKMLTLDRQKPQVAFTLSKDLPPTTVLLLDIKTADHTWELILTPDKAPHDLPGAPLKPGNVQLTVTAADPTRRLRLATETFQLNARDLRRPPENACLLQRDGRAFVNGKPFMPIGVYGIVNDRNLSQLAQDGFNCLITYGSLTLQGRQKTGNRLADIRAGLDRFQNAGLKCIFSLKDQYDHKPAALSSLEDATTPTQVAAKVVNAIKDHPALLCWYINDEEQRNQVPRVVSLRQTISALDPWHPTWSLTYRNEDFPYYGVSGDIMGTDKYMLDSKPVQNLEQVVAGMVNASSSGQAVWIVPQSFNWQAYKTKDPKLFAQGHFPSEAEIRAHTLIGVIFGAKGFVYYSHFDVLGRGEKLQPGSAKREWPKTLASVQLLRRLEPYIMSGTPITHLSVRQTGKAGKVIAACLTAADGRQAVIMVAVHDHAAGEVTLPDGSVLPYAPGSVNAKVIFR